VIFAHFCWFKLVVVFKALNTKYGDYSKVVNIISTLGFLHVVVGLKFTIATKGWRTTINSSAWQYGSTQQ